MVSRISFLILKFNRSGLTPDERAELDSWINHSPENAQLFKELTDPDSIQAQVQKMARYEEEEVRAKIEAREPYAFSARPKVRRIWYRISVAAAILILLGSGLYFYFNRSTPRGSATEPQNQLLARDIEAPKTNRATITLGNGRKIDLDSAKTGALAMQDIIKIEKTGDGQVAYSGNSKSGGAVEYNTLINPRGSRIVELTLNDGTRVWLNAESSLKYPTEFASGNREVEMTGEAYFEVKHNDRWPFRVKKDSAEIEVLGTHFNMNAYPDADDIKVTLLEGSVRLKAAAQSKILKPGQQGIVSNKIEIRNDIDTDKVMAWKTGNFMFDDETMAAIAPQLERWYDIRVEYEGQPSNEKFFGIVSRNSNVSQALKIMEGAGMRFRIQGKKIVVLK